MSEDWRKLGAVGPTELVEARMQLHYAAQIASGVGRTWLPKQDDDSHTNLGWRETIGGLAGRTALGEPSLAAGLDFAGLRLLLLGENDRILAELALDGNTLDQAYQWLQSELATRWGAETGDFAPLHYEMPDHELGRGGVFRRDAPEAFEELARWYANASDAFERVRSEHTTSPVRCWPHHFDFATLIPVQGERSIGVGLSPGDDRYAEPYFYVGPWPHPKPAEWPALPHGRWHTDGFVAAVLTGSELVAMASQAASLTSFLDSAIGASRRLLAN